MLRRLYGELTVAKVSTKCMLDNNNNNFWERPISKYWIWQKVGSQLFILTKQFSYRHKKQYQNFQKCVCVCFFLIWTYDISNPKNVQYVFVL